MRFLTRSVKHRPVALLIFHLTGGGATVRDFNGRWQGPITDEAIPHSRGELSGLYMLITLHDLIILQVGYRVQQSSFRLPDKRFLYPLVQPLWTNDIFAVERKIRLIISLKIIKSRNNKK